MPTGDPYCHSCGCWAMCDCNATMSRPVKHREPATGWYAWLKEQLDAQNLVLIASPGEVITLATECVAIQPPPAPRSRGRSRFRTRKH